MSAIKNKNTSIELLLRRALHKRGFRYRLHNNKLPGKPDIVFPKYEAVVFVHGCFWHAHENCKISRIPKSNTDYWKAKILRNVERDSDNKFRLFIDGWRILTVWECALKGSHRLAQDIIVSDIEDWLLGEELELNIRGNLA